MDSISKVVPFVAHPPLAVGVLKTLGYGIGALVVLMAFAVYMTQMDLSVILAWLEKVFSMSFIILYLSLMGLGIWAGISLAHPQMEAYWFEIGQQASSGVATLALTYTLLGLSMGIGSLSDQQITPDTIQQIIQGLTTHFSTAFMTTVVGLPSANALRAFVSIRRVKLQIASTELNPSTATGEIA
ncbi:MAG: hypothetical protein ACI9FJ_000596 [Alteromonadaceae bacterium]|jgi:hypothetical protein